MDPVVRGGHGRDRVAGVTHLAPARAAAATTQEEAPRSETGSPAPGRPRTPTAVEAFAILFITVACGLSPALFGFYRIGVWGPIALGMLAILLALVIARPAVPTRRAWVALSGLGGLWLWSLMSTGWAESADLALTGANRWLLYLALFGVLVMLLREDRLSVLLWGRRRPWCWRSGSTSRCACWAREAPASSSDPA